MFTKRPAKESEKMKSGVRTECDDLHSIVGSNANCSKWRESRCEIIPMGKRFQMRLSLGGERIVELCDCTVLASNVEFSLQNKNKSNSVIF